MNLKQTKQHQTKQQQTNQAQIDTLPAHCKNRQAVLYLPWLHDLCTFVLETNCIRQPVSMFVPPLFLLFSSFWNEEKKRKQQGNNLSSCFIQLASDTTIGHASIVFYCQTVFGVSLAFVVHSMNSMEDQRVSSLLTSELVMDERERRLQHRWERQRAHHDSETAEQSEKRLRKWRMRDRARHAAQTVQQGESYRP